MSLMLVAMLKRSLNSESSNDTARPRTSDRTARPNSRSSREMTASSRPLASQASSVAPAGGAFAIPTTASMMSAPT